MTSRKFLTSALGALLVAGPVAAQTMSTQLRAIQAAATRIDTGGARARSDTTAVAVLRAQNALMREYDQRLLATIYWSLGGLGVIATLLLGFGWFTNFKVYERDKAALREELTAASKKELDEIRGEMMKEAEHTRKALAKAGSRAADDVRRALNAEVASIEQRFLSLEYKMAEAEADGWQERKVYTNEIRAALAMLALAQQLDHDWRASRSLDRVLRALRAGATPDADLAREVVTALDALPTAYVTEVESIKSALRASRG